MMTLKLALFTGGLLVSFSAAGLAADPAAGKAKYDMLCTSCHGAQGKGDGMAAAALNPKPRDLTATTKTDVDMAKIIKEGGPSAGLSASMPAWGSVLNDQDIANVIAYIRSLKK